MAPTSKRRFVGGASFANMQIWLTFSEKYSNILRSDWVRIEVGIIFLISSRVEINHLKYLYNQRLQHFKVCNWFQNT